MKTVNLKSVRSNLGLVAAAALGVGLAGGCAKQADVASLKPVGDGFFESESSPRLVDSALMAQAAEGARSDGMLYESHFDDNALNSLGQTKLALIMQGSDSSKPMKLYMVAADSTDRRKSVVNYLTGAGVAGERITFELGAKPGSEVPAAEMLAAQARAREIANKQSQASEASKSTTTK